MVQRCTFLLPFLSILFLNSVFLHGQTIQIPGIQNLSFEKSDSDYSHAITGNFTVHSLKFVPESLTLHWDAANTNWTISGTAHIMVFDDLIPVSSGLGAVSGITIRGDSLSEASFSVSSDFTVSNITYKIVDSDYPVIEFSHESDAFVLHGNADMMVDGQTFSGGNLGYEQVPGVTIRNGIFEQFHYYIDNDLVHLFGLELNQPNMHVELDINDMGFKSSRYIGFGNVEFVYINNGVYGADLGDENAPSIRINNGVIDTVRISIAGGALLFGVLPTLGNINMEYDKSTSTYRFKGNILVGVPFGGIIKTLGAKYAPSATIDASGGGIEYRTNTKSIYVDEATFELGDIPLGSMELKELTIGVKDNELSLASAGIKLPIGVVLEGTLLFDTDPFRFNGIDILWEATSPAEALVMPGTGLEIVHISGGVENLDDIKNLTFKGSMGFVYGPEFKIAIIKTSDGTVWRDKNISAFYIEGDVEISPSELDASVSALVGALQSGLSWIGLLGEGMVELDLKFGVEYIIKGTLKLPTAPILEAKIEAKFDARGDMLALAEVILEIPPQIPFIGGKKLGDAEGVIHYIVGKPGQSYAAGWTKINFGFGKHSIGGKVEFSTGEFKALGSKGISNIKDDVKTFNTSEDTKMCSWWKSIFVADEAILPSYLQVSVKIVNHDNVIISDKGLSLQIIPPDYASDHIWVEQVQFGSDGELTRVDSGYWASTIALNPNQDSVYLVGGKHEALHYSSDGTGELDPSMPLSIGGYQLEITGECPADATPNISDFDIQINYGYPPPYITIANQRATYGSHFYDSATVAIYQNLYRSTQNGTLADQIEYAENEVDKFFPPYYHDFKVDPGIIAQEYVYYYGVIDDNVHAPVYSVIDSLSFPIGFRFNFGTRLDSILVILTFTENNQIISHQFYTNATDDDFYFYNVPDGHYSIDIYLPDNPLRRYSWWRDMLIDNNGYYDVNIRQPDWMNISINKGGLATIILSVEASSAEIYGEVYDENNNPIQNVLVELLDHSGNFINQVQTTTAGYGFFNFLQGNYSLRFTLPNGYHWQNSQINVDNPYQYLLPFEYDGVLINKDVYARTGDLAIYGRVYDTATGQGLAKAIVIISASTAFGSFQYSAHTNQYGYYNFKKGKIAGLNTYNIVVGQIGYVTVEENPTVHYGTSPVKRDIEMKSN